MYFISSVLWPSCLSFFLALTSADEGNFFRDQEYNDAAYGSYPHQSFHTTKAVAPRVNFIEYFNKTECDDGSKIFIAPRGNKADATPVMLDSSGTLIWTTEHIYGEVYNFQMQEYKGTPYLFFWAGNDAIGGHGEGYIHMLDKHYNEYRKISAGNGMGADLHSFEITVDDTAITSVYQPIEFDLSSADGTRGKGWIWDGLFQELDIETGEVKFQWRASEHIALNESYEAVGVATEKSKWDWLHLNSVEKDTAGNYLMSSRYLRSIVYISGQTGEVLWRLGGKLNSFHDLSDGKAIQFMGQHDAHWANDEHTALTFFDNRGDWTHRIEDQSRGTRVALDLEHMTVKLEHSYANPNVKIWSTSQGSYQTLPNGHVLLGYGHNGVLTEFSPDGQVLCDAQFMAASKFRTGDVQSYRNLKFNWTGEPLTDPTIVFHEDSLYMSWMGSTEVKSWLLQDSHWTSGPIKPVTVIPKREFETEFQVIGGEKPLRRYVRVVALGADAQVLGSSKPVDLGEKATLHVGEDVDASTDSDQRGGKMEETLAQALAELKNRLADERLLLGLSLFSVLSLLLVLWFAVGRRKRAIGHPEAQIKNHGFHKRRASVWQRLRSKLPGGRRGWLDGADFHRLPGSEASANSTPATAMEMDDEHGPKQE